MSKRTHPSPGLSYVEANRGRIVAFEADVLGYKGVIEAQWPELKVTWDTENCEWCIIQTDRHGSESLVFATKALGEHTLERLHRADNTRSDPLDVVDDWNDKMLREQDYRNAQAIMAVGEKLAWAIRKDEFNGPSPRVFFPDHARS